MKNTRYDILSPDGFSIHFENTYTSIKQAKKALKTWSLIYSTQGYYSSCNYGRIPVKDIPKYCTIITINKN